MLKEKNVLFDIKQLLHRDTLLHTVKHCSTTTTGLTCIRMEGSPGVWQDWSKCTGTGIWHPPWWYQRMRNGELPMSSLSMTPFPCCRNEPINSLVSVMWWRVSDLVETAVPVLLGVTNKVRNYGYFKLKGPNNSLSPFTCINLTKSNKKAGNLFGKNKILKIT